MLAFMASRNVRESMAIVHEGKVMLPFWQLIISHRKILVAAIHMESVFTLWSSIEYI